MKLHSALVIALSIFAASLHAEGRGFTVDFSNCTEFAGVGPVDLAKATALVPSVFTIAPTSGTGALVVRATSCTGIKVNGGRSTPTTISQIGLEIVPPDGTGQINNFTLIYVSNNPALVEAFREAGVPALYDPTLTYQFTSDSTGKAGELYVKVESLGLPAYFITGTETDPTTPGSDFKANWWYASGSRTIVKQASDFPSIAFGLPTVALHTDRTGPLGKLIGGNTDSDFHYFPVRGIYASAHMEVTVGH